MEKQKIISLLKLIRKEQKKEKDLMKGISVILEGNGFTNICDGVFEVINILEPDVYLELSYYLWECNGKGRIITKLGKEYKFDNDEDFILYLEEEGFLTT